jgi:tRNA A-37 threonylcarbamoyl transferase component Bud32
MVVMDRVHGELAWDVVRRSKPILSKVYEDIHNAIELLHSHNLVFGDLRTPNIMVASGSDTGARCRGLLIDFDWIGDHGTTRYPATLDDSLDWASPGIQ